MLTSKPHKTLLLYCVYNSLKQHLLFSGDRNFWVDIYTMTIMRKLVHTGKSFSAILLVLLASGIWELKAQKFELSPFIGYETGSKVYTSLGYIYIGDGTNYGGSFDFNLRGNRFGEISFSHMMSRLNVDDGTNERFICDLGVNYYSIGILQETKPGARINPYGLLTLGWVNYNPQKEDISGENKMHISLAGGIRIKASERIGFRLQARLLMPIFYAGANFNSSTGGTSTHISSTSVAFQGDFTAAIVFVIK
jgi:hypothetical protein